MTVGYVLERNASDVLTMIAEEGQGLFVRFGLQGFDFEEEVDMHATARHCCCAGMKRSSLEMKTYRELLMLKLRRKV